jgi:hypothetical protein
VSVELVLAAALAAGAVVVVALPFLRDGAPPRSRMPSDRELARAEERDRVLAELKELEFDHRTGKITEEDYRALVGPLRREAAAALPATGPPGSNGAQLSDEAGEQPSEHPFSATSSSSSRSDR